MKKPADPSPQTPEGDPPVEIPWRELSADALDGLIAEFVTRDGTDYGTVEKDLESKKRSVRRQLEAGEIRILFDPATSSANFHPR